MDGEGHPQVSTFRFLIASSRSPAELLRLAFPGSEPKVATKPDGREQATVDFGGHRCLAIRDWPAHRERTKQRFGVFADLALEIEDVAPEQLPPLMAALIKLLQTWPGDALLVKDDDGIVARRVGGRGEVDQRLPLVGDYLQTLGPTWLVDDLESPQTPRPWHAVLDRLIAQLRALLGSDQGTTFKDVFAWAEARSSGVPSAKRSTSEVLDRLCADGASPLELQILLDDAVSVRASRGSDPGHAFIDRLDQAQRSMPLHVPADAVDELVRVTGYAPPPIARQLSWATDVARYIRFARVDDPAAARELEGFDVDAIEGLRDPHRWDRAMLSALVGRVVAEGAATFPASLADEGKSLAPGLP